MTMKQPSEEEFHQGQNSGWWEQADKTYSTEEYKNLQAFWTKANQWLINVSKKLAEKDPKELLAMDAQIQNKVIKDLYGYDNVEELKIMLPDVFKEKDDDWYDSWNNEDALEIMKREQNLLKMKLNKKEVNDEIEKFTIVNSSVASSIPNFDTKVSDELKYISNELPVKERVDRAIKLVSGNSDLSVEAYLNLQWKTNVKSSSQTLTDDYVLDAQNKLRASFWLKTK